ncbi:MAG: HAD family phosphatase [Oscillospiraceae bacterium]|nr:HAD family phosphatase [Oscillospiraceae bacterium]
MIRAAIFDMDGLMFDTERVGREAWNRVGEELGLGRMDEVNERCLGCNKEYCRKVFEDTFHGRLSLDRMLELAEPYRKEYFRQHGMPCKKGLKELLDYLKTTGRKIAMATSSDRADAEYNLTLAGLREYFDLLVCGDMVKKSKPDPDIYRTAARLLEVDPKECVGLEDSRNGILSVHAAGMKAVLVPDLIPANEEMRQAADVVLNDLSEVPEWIESLH